METASSGKTATEMLPERQVCNGFVAAGDVAASWEAGRLPVCVAFAIQKKEKNKNAQAARWAA
jgi:hypothetical protein